MAQISGIVTEARPRIVERRDGSGSFPIYEIWVDGQGPFVARKDVYNQAERLLNQHVTAVTRSEQKGTFLNHYLDFIEGGAGDVQQAMQQAQAAQASAGNSGISQQPMTQATTTQQAQSAAQVMQQPNETERERNLSIQRQKATDIAAILANLSGNVSPLVYWENVQALARYYQTGEIPNLPELPPPMMPRQNADAYRPYQEDPGPDPSMPSREDDQIPFMPTIYNNDA